MTQPVLKVFLKDGAKLPAYAKPGDSGLDLCATKDVWLSPGRPVLVGTGVHVEIPSGHEAQVRPRSSLSAKGVVCSLGTVDSGYTGEIGAVLTALATGAGNVTTDGVVSVSGGYLVKAGDKIAQLVIAPVANVAVQQVQSLDDLSETERGASGWGSSGR